MWERFFTQAPKSGESMAKFVLRVEQEHRRQGLDEVMIYHAFVHKVDDHTKAILDNLCVMKKAMNQGTTTWQDVVEICRYHLSGVALLPPPGKACVPAMPT